MRPFPATRSFLVFSRSKHGPVIAVHRGISHQRLFAAPRTVYLDAPVDALIDGVRSEDSQSAPSTARMSSLHAEAWSLIAVSAPAEYWLPAVSPSHFAVLREGLPVPAGSGAHGAAHPALAAFGQKHDNAPALVWHADVYLPESLYADLWWRAGFSDGHFHRRVRHGECILLPCFQSFLLLSSDDESFRCSSSVCAVKSWTCVRRLSANCCQLAWAVLCMASASVTLARASSCSRLAIAAPGVLMSLSEAVHHATPSNRHSQLSEPALSG